jgi:hypothetical protein
MQPGPRTHGDDLVALLSTASAALRELPVCVSRLTGGDALYQRLRMEDPGDDAAAVRARLRADMAAAQVAVAGPRQPPFSACCPAVTRVSLDVPVRRFSATDRRSYAELV